MKSNVAFDDGVFCALCDNINFLYTIAARCSSSEFCRGEMLCLQKETKDTHKHAAVSHNIFATSINQYLIYYTSKKKQLNSIQGGPHCAIPR